MKVSLCTVVVLQHVGWIRLCGANCLLSFPGVATENRLSKRGEMLTHFLLNRIDPFTHTSSHSLSIILLSLLLRHTSILFLSLTFTPLLWTHFHFPDTCLVVLNIERNLHLPLLRQPVLEGAQRLSGDIMQASRVLFLTQSVIITLFIQVTNLIQHT